MQLAQRLYEAGLITYMRTDSVNYLKMLWKLLRQKLLNRTERVFKPRTLSIKVKEHSARGDRPTDMSRHTVNIDRDQARLYDLIWKRTLASQMSDAK
jgi:DNA topoisomerase-1